MSAPPITVNERDTLYDAMVLVRAHHIRHLPVVNGRGEIVGLVTQSDITRAYFRLFEDLRNTIEKSLDARTKDLLEANERLKALSLEDPLLHVGNRRAMEVDLEYTHAAYVRYRRPYSAVLFDIDCFKAYNDHYGHLAGDQALKSVADVLARGIRKTDRVYRFGGEEFLVLCPETPVDGALTLAKRLVGRVHDQRWQHAKSPHGVVTMSGGVGGVGNHEAWRDVLQEADAALYRAKAAGRNQVAWIDPFDPADHV